MSKVAANTPPIFLGRSNGSVLGAGLRRYSLLRTESIATNNKVWIPRVLWPVVLFPTSQEQGSDFAQTEEPAQILPQDNSATELWTIVILGCKQDNEVMP